MDYQTSEHIEVIACSVKCEAAELAVKAVTMRSKCTNERKHPNSNILKAVLNKEFGLRNGKCAFTCCCI